jgi:ParB/RepB/Spo0J family partition protein
MQKAGYEAFETPDGSTNPSLWQLATSKDLADRHQYVELIDKFDPSIKELAASIIVNGLVEPVVLRGNRGETFSIVAGARRCLAVAYNYCRGAGQAVVEAWVNKDSNVENLYRGIAENSCRKDPNPLERVRAYQMLVNTGSTVEQVAEREGISAQTVKNYLKLLELEPKYQARIAAGTLNLTSALTLLRNGEPAEEEVPERVHRHGGDGPRRRVKSRKKVEYRYQGLISEFKDREHMDAADRREVEVLEWVLGIEGDDVFK